jgi:hypothetical protein
MMPTTAVSPPSRIRAPSLQILPPAQAADQASDRDGLARGEQSRRATVRLPDRARLATRETADSSRTVMASNIGRTAGPPVDAERSAASSAVAATAGHWAIPVRPGRMR